jgi:hypothetical protein
MMLPLSFILVSLLPLGVSGYMPSTGLVRKPASHHYTSPLIARGRPINSHCSTPILFSNPEDEEGSAPSEADTPEVNEVSGSTESKSISISTENKSLSQRIRSYFAPDDGLTFRQRLGKVGLSCALAYGWVSNMSYSVTVSLAWYIFSKQTGKSPLAPGQWKGFLAVYAGFWVFNNIVRPLRLTVAIAIGPQFDNVVAGIEKRMRVSRGVAIFITVLFANLFGTILAMASGVLLASTLAGVPVFAK